ncbi:MAG: bile acid:sodium symporter family protein [Thermoleophilaceae bacterium]|nr:bile acid:sodium symporter family protein [Thermoleophilaceae bacterium]
MDESLVTTVAVPIGLALIMTALGLSLVPDDFRRVVSMPRGVAIGMVNLAFISPLLAFLAAELFGLSPVMAAGLVLLGAAPGGTMANLLTHLARGDTALSVTITAVSSICALVTVPLYLGLAIDHFGATEVSDEFSMLPVVLRVFAITIVPLAIGMSIRARYTEWAVAFEPRAKRIALAVFFVVVAGAVVAENDSVRENLREVLGAAVALNLSAMAIGFATARAARLDDRQATAISMELGVHHSAIAIAVAATISPELAVPAAVYASFMFFSAGFFAWFMSRRIQTA